MDVQLTCPFGSVCEEIRDDKIYRCRLYQQMEGRSPNGEKVREWDCTFNWNTVQLAQVSQMANRSRVSTEDLRNHVVEGNRAFAGLLTEARNAETLPSQ